MSGRGKGGKGLGKGAAAKSTPAKKVAAKDKEKEAMEDAKEDALEEEQEPVDTSTTAAPQSSKLSDIVKASDKARMCSISRAVLLDVLEDIRSLERENKELRVLLRLRSIAHSHEEFSAFMVETRRDLDEAHFAELLPKFKLGEERILAAQKFAELMNKLTEERDQEEDMTI